MKKIYVYQHGAKFYLSVKPGGERYILEAPVRVADFSLEDAKEARTWFKAHAKENGFEPVFGL